MKLASIINRYCLQHPSLTPMYLSVPDCSKWSWQVSGRSCEVCGRSCMVSGRSWEVSGRSWHWEWGYILGITKGYLRDIWGISVAYIKNFMGGILQVHLGCCIYIFDELVCFWECIFGVLPRKDFGDLPPW